MRPHDDALGSLAAGHAPEEGGLDPHGHLDDDLLAGFVAGSLDEATRALAEGHLSQCPDCREILTAVAPTQGVPASSARLHTRGRGRPWLAVAAVVLIGLGAGLLISRGDGGAGGQVGLDQELARLAAMLRKDAPAALRDFELLGSAELMSEGPPPMRGGARTLLPSGTCLDPRPPFQWRVPPGAEATRLQVRGQNGGVVLDITVSGTRSAYPPSGPALEAGQSYAWSVTLDTATGPVKARGSFQVAHTALAAHIESGREQIEARVPTGYQRLLLAHLMARHQCWQAAWAALSGEPTDVEQSMVAELRAYVARQVGFEEGE